MHWIESYHHKWYYKESANMRHNSIPYRIIELVRLEKISKIIWFNHPPTINITHENMFLISPRIYACPSISPGSICISLLSPVSGSSSSTSSVAQRWHLSFLILRQLCISFLSLQQGKLHSFARSHSFPDVPVSSQFLTFSVVRPSCPPRQIIPWSQISIAEQ